MCLSDIMCRRCKHRFACRDAWAMHECAHQTSHNSSRSSNSTSIISCAPSSAIASCKFSTSTDSGSCKNASCFCPLVSLEADRTEGAKDVATAAATGGKDKRGHVSDVDSDVSTLILPRKQSRPSKSTGAKKSQGQTVKTEAPTGVDDCSSGREQVR